MRRFLNGVCLCAAGGLVLSVVTWLVANGPAKPPAFRDLTPEVRGRIDRLADETAPETLDQEKIDFGGSITAWVISQTTLTPEEERERAEESHRKIVKNYRVVETPPEAERVFRQLVDTLPPHQKPACFRYTLTVLDVPEVNAFTIGAGLVYVNRPLLTTLLEDPDRGPQALAFILGHELGHTAHLHCRRGYQLMEIRDELKDNIKGKVDPGLLQRTLRTSVNVGALLVPFLYSREQEYEADLFGLHLCRNAGFNTEQALDAMRYFVLLRQPELRNGAAPRAAGKVDESLWFYYLSSHPDPLRRLKRLRMELDGRVVNETEHGLFAYDREADKLIRCTDGSVGAGQKPVVFVHGLRGNERSFQAYLEHTAKQKDAAGRPLLVFRWPNNQSLARSGRFLHNEIGRVLRAPEEAVFVCHSAGGLVFRCYAEVHKGPFDRASFLGTPHQGSDLTALKFLVDADEFLREVKLGIPEAIARTVPEGRGEITHDLHPDSLFLRHLGHDAELASRYRVYGGKRLSRAEVFVLRTGLEASKVSLRRKIDTFDSPLLRRRGRQLLDELRLTEEITDGDLVVSVDSASLKGAARVTIVPLDHLKLKTDRDLVREVMTELLAK